MSLRDRKSLSGCLFLWLALAAQAHAQTVALPAAADTSLRASTPNQNRGTETLLQFFSADSRILLRFDQTAIASAVGSGRLVSASLELYVRSAAHPWGTDGRPVEAHRVTADWTETGATWHCGIDTQPTNGSANCATQWAGGTFEEDSTDTMSQTNEEHRWVQLDVTADVAAFLTGTPNRGWLLKKSDEDPGGPVEYASREGNALERPRLVLLVESAAHDQVPPTLRITSPDRSILINEPSPAVTVDYADGGSGVDLSSFQFLVDAQDATASCTAGAQSANCHLSALAAGNHTLQARLRDNAGNPAQASFGFQLLLGSGPHMVTFQTVADTYLRKGADNRNQGTETVLRVKEGGKNRTLIQFDPQGLLTTISGATLVSASLELHVESNGRNWGKTGRTVDVHRMTEAWTETGATWSCAVDANPSNSQPDCAAQWNGGTFAPAATASVLHTKELAGWVSFDVTSDVAAFVNGTSNHGWLLKKTDERKSGQVAYDSRQGSAGEGPRLVVIFETAAETDSTPPVITITSPAEGSFLSTPSILVTGTVVDDGQVTSVTVNDTEVSLVQGAFQASVTLAPGGNEILAVATDATDKKGFATRSVTLDLTPPLLVVQAPAPGQLTNRSEIRVAGEASDDLAFGELTVQGNPVAVIDGSFETRVPVSPGANPISLRAVDQAGNETLANLEVTRFDLPEVKITSPADLSFLASTTVDVNGTVNDPAARITVNGLPAILSGTTFTARGIPLIEGGNTLTAAATDGSGHVATASVNVVRDLTPPRLAIQEPENGAVLFAPAVTVSGMVNDIVAGTVNASEASVKVNGQPAMVANRSFVAQGVPLTPGENVLTVVATDASGNVGEARITVRREAPGGERISIVAGNLQSGVIGTQLSEPLVVSLTDAAGLPVSSRPVLFKVRGNNGTVGGDRRQIVVVTDAAGRASTRFTLGTRAGVGSPVVVASSPGFQGTAVFLATALAGEPALVVVDSGNQQVGIAGRPLPRPLVAVVTDRGYNRLAGAAVRLKVVQGQGRLADGLPEALLFSDSDGRVIVPLTLDPEEGIANNVVEARIEGLDASPIASFIASGRAAGDPVATSISGVVLDNSNQPLGGVTLRILDTALTARTDEHGLFRINPAPVGTVKLVVDGSTVDRPGSWPDLEFVLTTIPGRDNTVNMPIYLLPLDLRSGLAVDETHGGVLSLPEIPGFSLEVAPGSVTFPGGSKSGIVSVTVVHNDKVPMVPNFGQQPRLIVTIQPAGARFEPPARLTFPNVEGLAPGEVTEMYSFDHDLGHFVSIGPATVSEDGSVIVSNPGVGVLKAGWHCGGNPATAGTPHRCPECTSCIGDRCEALSIDEGIPCHDDLDPCTADFCAHGTCVHKRLSPVLLVLRLAEPLVLPEESVALQAEIFPHCPGNEVRFSAAGEEGSGGHEHIGNRPAGTFSPSRCTTDATGRCIARYRATAFGGRELITAQNGQLRAQKNLDVMVPFLVPLGGGDVYNLVGETDKHSNNHNIAIGLRVAMIDIANEYHLAFPDAELLNINDISLPRGGLFDIQGHWGSPHISHREGRDVDVKSTAIPVDNRETFVTICRTRGVNPVLENAGISNEHYHLNF